jgi:hypothetical protein
MKRVIDWLIWRLFYMFERLGVHVLPVHYYSPIPDTRLLRKHLNLLLQEHPLYGVEKNETTQLNTLKILQTFENEYISAGRGEFGVIQSEMPSYAPINALALYAFVRYFTPKKVVEVGAGMSTKITAAAMTKK